VKLLRKPGPVSDGLPRPSAPWGWMLKEDKLAFRVKLLRKTGPVSDSLPRPSAAFCPHRRPGGGPLGVGVKRRKISVSCEASSKNRTSVGQRSAAICSLLPPSAPWGWVLSVGTGLRPQTPPNLLVMFLLLVLSELFSHAEGGRRNYFYVLRVRSHFGSRCTVYAAAETIQKP